MSKTMIVCHIIIGLCNVVILVSQAIAYKEEKKLKKAERIICDRIYEDMADAD